ncbi:MAG: PAS domain S-box protein [Anaerolineales bacterium]|nr:PAS domain S-box protein [Anaerolineales bacterium]
MNWTFPTSALPLLFAGILSLVFTLGSWRYRDKPIGRAFIVLTLLVAIWSFGEYYQRGAQTDFQRVLATSINFTAIPLVGPLILIFTLLFTDQARLVNRLTLTLCVGWGVLISLLMWTNAFHGLLFREITMAGFVRGPLFMVHTGVSYLFLLTSIVLVARLFWRSTAYRLETGLLLLGVTYPFVGNLLFVLQIVPLSGDWTPFNFVIALVFVATGLYLSGKLNIVPMARRAVLDSLEDLLILVDEQGMVISLNDAARRAFGIPAGTSHPRPIQDLLGAAAPAPLHAGETRTITAELMLSMPDGQAATFDLRGSALHDVTDGLQGYVYLLRDVTGRKQAEAALRQERQHAEALAEDYRRARDEALRADEAKSELLARVSHELRTPLGAILGYAETLGGGLIGPVNEKQARALQRIMSNGDDLLYLVNEILDEAQLSSDQVRMSNEPFNPVAILEHVMAQMGPAAVEKGLQLEQAVGDGLPALVIGDPVRCQQVLTNLVSNAIKFTDEGCVRVELFSAGAAHWGFAVTDTGPGIPTDKQALIFEPFQQLEQAHTRRVGGIGLGLSIVQKIVNRAHGLVELESEPGHGCTFRVTFPVAVADEENVGVAA